MPQKSPSVVYHADSRLKHPAEFVKSALRDAAKSLPAARRLFIRNLATQYRHSSLGLAWAFIPVIITAVAISIGQKTQIISTHRGDVPPPFYGVFGLAMAQTFVDGVNGLRMVFDKHAMILKRNRVPTEGLIAAAFIDLLFGLFIRLTMITLVCMVFKVKPVATFPIAIVGFLGILLSGAGLGLMLAPFSSLKRDIDSVMNYFPWILFAITPVFVKTTPGTTVALIHQWNPLGYVMNSTRSLMYGAPGPRWAAVIAVPVGLALITFGWLSCRFCRPYVVERML